MNAHKTIWIIDHYSSEPQYGGISRQYDFAKELDKRGYRIVIFSSGFSHYTHSYISQEQVFVTEPSRNIRYVYLKTSRYKENNGSGRAGNMISFLFQVLRHQATIARRYGKPDVVMGCSVHPLAWIAAYKIAKKYRIRFVAEVRDFWPQFWIDSGEMKRIHPMAIFFAMVERFTFSHADRIVYSLYHGDRYICHKKGVAKNKTCLIGQPMDCRRFDKNSKESEKLTDEIKDFISEGFICVFAGYFMEYDGVYVMLEAQKILQSNRIPVKMVFVGSGSEKNGMIHYVKENQLSNVLIADRISKEAIPALITRSNICMAHIETKGHENVFKYGVSKNKINEYLYSGACTLFGFRFDDNEVVESEGGLQFEPYNAVDLAEKITWIYGLNLEEQRKFGERGREYIKTYHSVEVLTDKLLEVLFSFE